MDIAVCFYQAEDQAAVVGANAKLDGLDGSLFNLK